LDGPLPKWCPAVALSRQDGRHSAVALLLKAALIQVSDYRLLGASGFYIRSRFWFLLFWTKIWLDIIAQTTVLQHTELRMTLIHATCFNILDVHNLQDKKYDKLVCRIKIIR
jgi:hypothetical protein